MFKATVMPMFELNNELITGIALGDYTNDYSQLVLHLFCEVGDEKQIFDSLPLWVHKHVEITQGCMQVLINLKP